MLHVAAEADLRNFPEDRPQRITMPGWLRSCADSSKSECVGDGGVLLDS